MFVPTEIKYSNFLKTCKCPFSMFFIDTVLINNCLIIFVNLWFTHFDGVVNELNEICNKMFILVETGFLC